jgi:hypothetical protein
MWAERSRKPFGRPSGTRNVALGKAHIDIDTFPMESLSIEGWEREN